MSERGPGLRDQESWRSFLRVGGPIVFGIGLVLTAIAMISFFSAFGSFGTPQNFWMAFVGIPLMGLGSAMMKAGYLGPASRYVAGELSPTLRDTLGYLGVGGGPRVVCPSCDASNDADARFCDGCGAAIATTCPKCQARNAVDANFCDDCGTAIEARA